MVKSTPLHTEERSILQSKLEPETLENRPNRNSIKTKKIEDCTIEQRLNSLSKKDRAKLKSRYDKLVEMSISSTPITIVKFDFRAEKFDLPKIQREKIRRFLSVGDLKSFHHFIESLEECYLVKFLKYVFGLVMLLLLMIGTMASLYLDTSNHVIPLIFVFFILITWSFKQSIRFQVYKKIKAKVKYLELKFNFSDIIKSNALLKKNNNDFGGNHLGYVWIIADIDNIPQKGKNSGFRLRVKIYKQGYVNHESWSDDEEGLHSSKMHKELKILQK